MSTTTDIVHFESKLLKTDVTAVKLLKNDVLLIGIGSDVHLYNVSNQQFIAKTSVFIGQKIHGFVACKDNNSFITYGGKQAARCCIKPTGLEVSTRISCSYWILNVIWIKNETQLAILTSHNILQIWDLSSKCVVSSHKCEEKCFLYSGLTLELSSCVLVMSGTVFSQVVVWDSSRETVNHRLIGHKGVIFSISYSEAMRMIITTSDDRSVRTWTVSHAKYYDSKSSNFWREVDIQPQRALFGHSARVFKNITKDNIVISIGEDAFMCTWNLNNPEHDSLINKRRLHQDGCLWALDFDIENDVIVTGGSDSGVIKHQNVLGMSPFQIETLLLDDEKLAAKKIALTARGNILCITEQGFLMYYDFEINNWNVKHRFASYKSYFKMASSLCRQFVAIAGIDGCVDVFVESCKYEPNISHCFSQKIIEGIIHSVHWIENRCLVICGGDGQISLWESRGESCAKIAEYVLPCCKERWTTAAALIPCKKNLLIVGDRCGNLHLFTKGVIDPVHTIPKVHGRLGINAIDFVDDKILTTGRNGTVKYFKIDKLVDKLVYLNHNKVPFEWVEKFIDRNKEVVCGFRETKFMVWNVKKHCEVLEVDCGGGHRSWDVMSKWLEYEQKTQHVIRYVFIHKNDVFCATAKVEKNRSESVIEGFHTREINDLKTIECIGDDIESYVFVSAGEDTIVRLNYCTLSDGDVSFRELSRITKHLSSIRCICLCPIPTEDVKTSSFILFTAGGRAQICISKITLNGSKSDAVDCEEIYDYMLKGNDCERRKNMSIAKTEKDFDAETRFMSLCYTFNKKQEKSFNITLFAGCSDGFLRVYDIVFYNNVMQDLKLKMGLDFHKRCILKVHSFHWKNNTIVLTFAVDGTVAFWNFTEFLNNSKDADVTIEPFYSLKIHKAGINAFDMKFLSEDKFVLATGGDDNAVHVNVMSMLLNESNIDVEVMNEMCYDRMHCAQLTGLKLFGRHFSMPCYLISASIDQRLSVVRLSLKDSSLGDGNLCLEYIGQYHTSISDVQGIADISIDRNEINMCLFGKGIDVISTKFTT